MVFNDPTDEVTTTPNKLFSSSVRFGRWLLVPDALEAPSPHFLETEVLAAQLEALTRAEPEVGNLWRSELALAEADARAWSMRFMPLAPRRC